MADYSKEFIDELTTASQIKTAIYGYFYKIFRAPVDENFFGLTEKFIPSFKELAKIIDTPNMKKAIENLEKYENEEKNTKDKEALIHTLNIQYTGLYLLGMGSVPTSASVFLSPEKLLKSGPWEKVCRIYSSRGFKMPDDFKEPEDHIAMETLYMEKLNDLVLRLIKDNSFPEIKTALSEQSEFLREHVLTWVNDFAGMTAAKSAEKPLYNGAALLLAEFVAYDLDLTQEFIDEL